MKTFLRAIVAFLCTVGIISLVTITWNVFYTPKPITQPSNPSPISSISPEERFSSGERLLNKITNPDVNQGIVNFKKGNYPLAYIDFEKANSRNPKLPSNPEIKIYQNNAEARINNHPFILAVVVPADTNLSSAEEMLRGVADAQSQFNENRGLDGRLLEIMIVNDSNEKDIAAQVAEKIAKNPNILGVIGHNSSDASKAALTVYNKVGLSMISPTSTSTELGGDVFFRTVPSDAKSGELLANYARRKNIKRVAIFYNYDSSYSKSLQKAFSENFSHSGENKIIPIEIQKSNFNPENELKTLQNQVQAIVLLPNTKLTKVALAIATANSQLQQPFKLLGGDALYKPETLIEGKNAVEGLVLPVSWFPSTSYATEAARRWKGQVNWRTAMSYDATQALIHALSSEANRTSILKNLNQTNLPASETSGKPLQFLSYGDRNTEPILVQVVKGGKNKPQGADYSFQPVQE